MEMTALTYDEQLAQAQAIGIPEQLAELQYGTLEEQHEQVDLLEESIYGSGVAIEIEPVHKFESGMYIRELTVPPGALITSEIHRTPHVCLLTKGTISVWTLGGPTVTLTAPYAFISAPDTRRVGFTHDETVWTTIHQTDKTNIAEIEQDIFVKREHPRVRLAKRLEGFKWQD